MNILSNVKQSIQINVVIKKKLRSYWSLQPYSYKSLFWTKDLAKGFDIIKSCVLLSFISVTTLIIIKAKRNQVSYFYVYFTLVWMTTNVNIRVF